MIKIGKARGQTLVRIALISEALDVLALTAGLIGLVGYLALLGWAHIQLGRFHWLAPVGK